MRAALTFHLQLVSIQATHLAVGSGSQHAFLQPKISLLPPSSHPPPPPHTPHTYILTPTAPPPPACVLQTSKQDEQQPSISSVLQPLAPGSSVDVVVAGCGPAGIHLAAHMARKGLRVGLVGECRVG